MRAVRRNNRQAYALVLGPVAQFSGIGLPQNFAALLDLFMLFKLSAEQGSEDVGGQITRSNVHPGVLVHLPPEKAAAIGPLLAQDLGLLNVGRIIDQQRPAFTATDVFRLVEAECGQAAKSSQRTASVAAEQPVCIVLDNRGTVSGQGFQCIHVAANAGIVDRHDRFGTRCEKRLQQVLVQVQCVRTNIDENRPGATEHESIDSRDKSERRHNDLVTGANVKQKGSHLQRMSAGSGQQHLWDT